MNRRGFIAQMLAAGVATAFLPGAGRIWKPSYSINPEWLEAEYAFFIDENAFGQLRWAPPPKNYVRVLDEKFKLTNFLDSEDGSGEPIRVTKEFPVYRARR